MHFTLPQFFFICLFVFCPNLSVSDDNKEEGLYRKIMMYHSFHLFEKKVGNKKHQNRNLFFPMFKEVNLGNTEQNISYNQVQKI